MKTNIKLSDFLLLAVVVGIFDLVLPIFFWKEIITVDQAIKILKYICTWPLAFLIVSLIFITKFQNVIDIFFRDIAKVSFGNVCIERQEELPNTLNNNKAEKSEEGSLKLSHEEYTKLCEEVEKIIEENNTSQETTEELKEDLRKAYILVFKWQFNFFDVFLVHNTRYILYLIACNPLKLNFYSESVRHIVNDDKQAQTILNILLNYNLISVAEETLHITPLGSIYLQYRNMLPKTSGEVSVK